MHKCVICGQDWSMCHHNYSDLLRRIEEIDHVKYGRLCPLCSGQNLWKDCNKHSLADLEMYILDASDGDEAATAEAARVHEWDANEAAYIEALRGQYQAAVEEAAQLRAKLDAARDRLEAEWHEGALLIGRREDAKEAATEWAAELKKARAENAALREALKLANDGDAAIQAELTAIRRENAELREPLKALASLWNDRLNRAPDGDSTMLYSTDDGCITVYDVRCAATALLSGEGAPETATAQGDEAL